MMNVQPPVFIKLTLYSDNKDKQTYVNAEKIIEMEEKNGCTYLQMYGGFMKVCETPGEIITDINNEIFNMQQKFGRRND